MCKTSVRNLALEVACAQEYGIRVERTAVDGMHGQWIQRIVLEDDDAAAWSGYTMQFFEQPEMNDGRYVVEYTGCEDQIERVLGERRADTIKVHELRPLAMSGSAELETFVGNVETGDLGAGEMRIEVRYRRAYAGTEIEDSLGVAHPSGARQSRDVSNLVLCKEVWVLAGGMYARSVELLVSLCKRVKFCFVHIGVLPMRPATPARFAQ